MALLTPIKGTDAKYRFFETESGLHEIRVYHGVNDAVTIGLGASRSSAVRDALAELKDQKREIRKMIWTVRWLRFKAWWDK